MKKTMFITSVIMVIVMAIALTTSSLAWFSAAGNTQVTTAAFKVTATAESTQGIIISKDRLNWSSSISLTNSGASGLKPLVPYTRGAAFNSSLTGDDLATEQTRIYDALLAALVGGTEAVAFNAEDSQTYTNIGTTSANSVYKAYMIGALTDSNDNFTANSVYRDGFYVDTFYIQNYATGYGASAVQIDTTITFSFDKITVNNNQDVVTDTEYTRAGRGENKYDLDPTLCVAVLALKGDQIADQHFAAYQAALTALAAAKAKGVGEGDNLYASEDEKAAAVAQAQEAVDAFYSDTYNEDGQTFGWEIIGYAESKGNGGLPITAQNPNYIPANIKLSKTYNEFWTNQTQIAGAADSFYSMPLASLTGANALNKTNTTPLRAAHTYQGTNIPADVKTIKVVAWYDGATLNNNNAPNTDQGIRSATVGAADLKFNLTFNVHSNG